MGNFEYMFRLRENTTFEMVTKSLVAFLHDMEGLQVKCIQSNTACMITIRQPVWLWESAVATRFVVGLRLFRMGGLVILEVCRQRPEFLEREAGVQPFGLKARLACFFASRKDRKRLEAIWRHLADLMDEVSEGENGEEGQDFYG